MTKVITARKSQQAAPAVTDFEAERVAEAQRTQKKQQDGMAVATAALVEAQVAAESIEAITQVLLSRACADEFGLLEAIRACITRLNDAVEPALEELSAP